MRAKGLIRQLFNHLPCEPKMDLEVVLRGDDKYVLKIKKLLDQGRKQANAATIWDGEPGIVSVITYEGGEQHMDWPDHSLDEIAQNICDFCVRKTENTVGVVCALR